MIKSKARFQKSQCIKSISNWFQGGQLQTKLDKKLQLDLSGKFTHQAQPRDSRGCISFKQSCWCSFTFFLNLGKQNAPHGNDRIQVSTNLHLLTWLPWIRISRLCLTTKESLEVAVASPKRIKWDVWQPWWGNNFQHHTIGFWCKWSILGILGIAH